MSSGIPANGPSSGEDETPVWRLAIASAMPSVGQANRSLEAFLDRRRVCPEVVRSAVLALEELVTNVIKYAYDGADDREIRLEVRLEPAHLVLRVSDDGPEFDPRSAAPPDRDMPFEERPVGGLGIHLVRSIAERFEYERAEGTNVVTVSFPLNPKN